MEMAKKNIFPTRWKDILNQAVFLGIYIGINP